jgi:Bacterial Ig-like domain (group 3)/F5/8 type C domain
VTAAAKVPSASLFVGDSAPYARRSKSLEVLKLEDGSTRKWNELFRQTRELVFRLAADGPVRDQVQFAQGPRSMTKALAAAVVALLSLAAFAVAGTVPTTTTVSVFPTAPYTGQQVTLTTTVTPQSGTIVPDGTVTFFDGATALGTSSVNASGSATLVLSSLTAGAHSFTATYNNFGTSTSAADNVTVQPQFNGARYWGIAFVSANGDPGINMDEIDLKLGSVDKAVGCSVMASSADPSFPATNAFDKNLATAWKTDYSNTWDQWIICGLSQNTLIDTVTITPATAAGAPSAFLVQYSLDGNTWVTVASFTGLTSGWQAGVTRSFSLGAPNTFYVAANGSDNNDGKTPVTAWQSLGKVFGSTFTPGQSVLLRGGDTFVGSALRITPTQLPSGGNPLSPFVLGSYGAGKATISANADQGPKTALLMVDCVSGVTIQDLIISPNGHSVPVGVLLQNSCDGNARSNLVVQRADISGFTTPSPWPEIAGEIVVNGYSFAGATRRERRRLSRR